MDIMSATDRPYSNLSLGKTNHTMLQEITPQFSLTTLSLIPSTLPHHSSPSHQTHFHSQFQLRGPRRQSPSSPSLTSPQRSAPRHYYPRHPNPHTSTDAAF